MSLRAFAEENILKYILTGTFASISIYLHIILIFPKDSNLYLFLKENGATFLLAGSVTLGFIITTYETYIYDFIEWVNIKRGKGIHKFSLRKNMVDIAEKYREANPKKVDELLRKLKDKKRYLESRFEFWAWLTDQNKQSHTEMIYRGSQASMLLFFSVILAFNLVAIVIDVLMNYLKIQ